MGWSRDWRAAGPSMACSLHALSPPAWNPALCSLVQALPTSRSFSTHLGGEEALGADAGQAQHTVERLGGAGASWQGHGAGRLRLALKPANAPTALVVGTALNSLAQPCILLSPYACALQRNAMKASMRAGNPAAAGAAANPAASGAHRKVLFGMSPSTFSRSRSTGTGASAGALRSLSTTRPLPSMAPITCAVEGQPGGCQRKRGGRLGRRAWQAGPGCRCTLPGQAIRTAAQAGDPALQTAATLAGQAVVHAGCRPARPRGQALGQAPSTHLHDAALALADGLQKGPRLWLDQQAVVLLVLCPPDLQHRHGLVAQPDGAHVDLGAQRVDDLLDHVAVAARALQGKQNRRACAAHPCKGRILGHQGMTSPGTADSLRVARTLVHLSSRLPNVSHSST